jgi:hypothetical protein
LVSSSSSSLSERQQLVVNLWRAHAQRFIHLIDGINTQYSKHTLPATQCSNRTSSLNLFRTLSLIQPVTILRTCVISHRNWSSIHTGKPEVNR